MNWKAIWGVLGGIIFIIYLGGTIYQLLNWDGKYWELVMNIAFAIVGLSLVMEWRKNRDGELMTDAEEKQVYQEWQDKKEDNSTS